MSNELTTAHRLVHGLLAGLLMLPLSLSLGIGCIVADTFPEPCDHGSNNILTENGECECRSGYEWCDPMDPDTLDCCEVAAETGTETGSS